MFTPTEWIIALIISLSCGILWYLADLYDARWASKHMGYSKDEWEGFIARYGYSRKQIQNICSYYGWDFPKNDEAWTEMEARMSLDLAEASMCHSSEDHEALCDFVIDGKGLGHWVRADTSTEVTPPRLGEPS